jgi:endonuclease YncB( thermonuclease family)
MAGGSGGRRPWFLITATLFAAGVATVFALPRGTSVPTDRVRLAILLITDKAEAAGVKVLPKRDAATSEAPASTSAPPAGARLRTVVRVVDGDTVVLDGNEKVRLTGINTPESVDPRRPVQWFGKEASAHAKSMLEGKRVRLETDVEPKDKYNRSLAYLYLEDGTFVNLRLVEDGYAFAYRYPPNVKHADEFRDAERRAREGGKGLWSDAAKAAEIQPKSRR